MQKKPKRNKKNDKNKASQKVKSITAVDKVLLNISNNKDKDVSYVSKKGDTQGSTPSYLELPIKDIKLDLFGMFVFAFLSLIILLVLRYYNISLSNLTVFFGNIIKL